MRMISPSARPRDTRLVSTGERLVMAATMTDLLTDFCRGSFLRSAVITLSEYHETRHPRNRCRVHPLHPPASAPRQ